MIQTWIYGLLSMLLGFILLKFLTYSTRTKKDTKFSLSYWWSDNKNEIIIGFILYIVIMLFFKDVMKVVLKYFDTPLLENKYFVLFLLGLFIHTILDKLRGVLGLRQDKYADGMLRVGDAPNPEHEEH